ncbi:MAG: hypothetical protein GY715_09135 [Planctomycetes bacterium]|nr:hypothetical protein [Planctomycetota bacterium]
MPAITPSSEPPSSPPLWRRLTMIEPGERGTVAWAAACFFLLLCSWYTIRPVREAMGLTGGVRDLKWLYVATMTAMFIVNPISSGSSSRDCRDASSCRACTCSSP